MMEGVKSYWKAFTRERLAAISLVVILLVMFAAILAPFISPYDYAQNAPQKRLLPPLSPGHLLGTDTEGRDVLSRIIWGSRVSLTSSVIPVAITIFVSILVGLMAGYYGGLLEVIIMRVLDVFFAFPMVLLGVAVAAMLGPGIINVMISMTVVLTPYVARVVFTAAAQITNRDFVKAARMGGSSDLRIMFGEILPNIIAPIAVYGTTVLGSMLVFAAGFSFLGLGIQPPVPDWGTMVADGRPVIMLSPHVSAIPGLAILIVALAFNFFGDGLRNALTPQLRSAVPSSLV
jgi:peptide/nickel transport system permease protein